MSTSWTVLSDGRFRECICDCYNGASVITNRAEARFAILCLYSTFCQQNQGSAPRFSMSSLPPLLAANAGGSSAEGDGPSCRVVARCFGQCEGTVAQQSGSYEPVTCRYASPRMYCTPKPSPKKRSQAKMACRNDTADGIRAHLL